MVVANLRQGLNLDDLDFVTDENGNAGVRAGKYLSQNLYSDITIGSNGTTEINLNVDINQNFTARGSTASDGDTSIGIFFEHDY
jgi:translocation and assembly module TamB